MKRTRPRVLVVDDSIVVRHILSITVRQLPGFDNAIVEEAGNGAVAFKKVQAGGYRFASTSGCRLTDSTVPAHPRALQDRETPSILITTSHPEDIVVASLRRDGHVTSLSRPYHSRCAARDSGGKSAD